MKRIILALIISLLLFAACDSKINMHPKRGPSFGTGSSASYTNGVNDALDHIIILDKELNLKQEQKSLSEKVEIVRQRLKIKQDGRLSLD